MLIHPLPHVAELVVPTARADPSWGNDRIREAIEELPERAYGNRATSA